MENPGKFNNPIDSSNALYFRNSIRLGWNWDNFICHSYLEYVLYHVFYTPKHCQKVRLADLLQALCECDHPSCAQMHRQIFQYRQ